MISPLCPICGEKLTMQKPAWLCCNRHSFDVARQGYVNLLTVSQKHSLHPGDSSVMVSARRSFLNEGYYLPIVNTLQKQIAQFAPNAESVLDAGCGEGYYLSHINIPERWGIDISKDAVRFAAVREKNAHWLTATAAHLPFADASFNVVLSMFALTAEHEFSRILKENGIFIQVLAILTDMRFLRPFCVCAKVAQFSSATLCFVPKTGILAQNGKSGSSSVTSGNDDCDGCDD